MIEKKARRLLRHGIRGTADALDHPCVTVDDAKTVIAKMLNIDPESIRLVRPSGKPARRDKEVWRLRQEWVER